MPHGRLTPLGKQLRCVLANFTTTRVAPASFTPAPRNALTRPELYPRSLDNGIVPAGHVSTRTIATATASAAIDADELHDSTPIPSAPRRTSTRALRKRTRMGHVGNALRATGKGHLQFRGPLHKLNLTYVDPKKRAGVSYAMFRRRQRRLKHELHAGAMSLQSILDRYMTEDFIDKQLLSADWQETDTLPVEETEFLRSKGYAIEDVVAWAGITNEEDIFEAAQKLATRNANIGVLATPLFVYLNLLRRRDIPGGALRVLLECARTIFAERAELLANPGIDDQPRFLAVVRLLRHARQVWPASMLEIVQLVLQDPRGHYREATCEQLSVKSHQLNKLMSLVSTSTKEQAFKNGDHQEAALIPILRYMSEHEPSLHINRQGYRAVIRIQLAQRKTSDEQQWAELKALSWPPWKEDRTGMDALITKEVHGMSRASQTLMRMREAGYRPLSWEQLAQVHAGWDIDGTPTIQNRVRLDEPGRRLSRSRKSPDTTLESSRWAARITSTRTIQEAWACYLAWEDKHLPPDQNVFLAIAIKLREEQRRPHIERRRASQAAQQKAWPLFPGDVRELSPLPPSSHLETYTRTRPPNLEDFYEDLRDRNMPLHGHALAFFIRHARTLPFGLTILRDSAERYPGINDMLSRARTTELARVPLIVYTAAIELFSRFGEVPVTLGIPRFAPDDDTGNLIDMTPELNQRSGIIHAIRLLQLRPESRVHMWNAVHQGLTREPNISRLIVPRQRRDENGSDQRATGMSEELRRCGGAFQAYRLSRYVRDLQARNRVPLNLSMFYSFCIVTEYRMTATWIVLQAAEANARPLHPQQSSNALDKLVTTAKSIYRDGSDLDVRTAPHQLFDQLVGVDVKTATSGAYLPRLLAVPSPAVLHVYIRTQGWLSRYQSLAELTQFMREYRAELLERRRQDRNGDGMMRRAIIALRVFLERSWLPRPEPGVDYGVMNDGSANADTRRRLKALRDPANEDRIKAIRAIVEEVEEWGGWPSDEEVEQYAADKRFQPFKEHEMKRNQRAGKFVPIVSTS